MCREGYLDAKPSLVSIHHRNSYRARGAYRVRSTEYWKPDSLLLLFRYNESILIGLNTNLLH